MIFEVRQGRGKLHPARSQSGSAATPPWLALIGCSSGPCSLIHTHHQGRRGDQPRLARCSAHHWVALSVLKAARRFRPLANASTAATSARSLYAGCGRRRPDPLSCTGEPARASRLDPRARLDAPARPASAILIDWPLLVSLQAGAERRLQPPARRAQLCSSACCQAYPLLHQVIKYRPC